MTATFNFSKKCSNENSIEATILNLDPGKGYGFVRPKNRQRFTKDVFFHLRMVVNVDEDSDVKLCIGLTVKVDLDGVKSGIYLLRFIS